MKWWVFDAVFTVLLVSVSLVRADYPGLVQSLNPVAYWRFNDAAGGDGTVAADSSSSATHVGLYRNGVNLTTTDLPGPGSGGKAASFDGIDDQIDSISTAGFPVGNANRSLTAWVKYNFPLRTYGIGQFFHYGVDAYNQHFAAGVLNTNDLYTARGAISVSRYGESVGTNPILDGQWHFFAVTVNNSNYRLYVDGNFVRQKVMTTNTASGTMASISALVSDTPARYWGLLDEMALFNMALTDQNIRDLYSEMAVPEPFTLSILALGGLALFRRRVA